MPLPLIIIAYFIITVCLVISLLIASSAVAILFVRVPFVPTPKKNIALAISLLDLKPGQIFYDLGCGDGRFLIAAEKYGVKAVGFEISPWAYLRARLNLLLNHSQAKIYYKNFYHFNVSDADAVICFLLDTVMPKVEKKLQAEFKQGARVVSYGFAMPTWQPAKIINTNPANPKSSKIYLYLKT